MPSTRGAAGPPPAKPPPPASTASSSSLSSSRQDRNTKSSNAVQSATPHSRSSEEMSEPPRRSQRAQPTKKDEIPNETNNIEAGEDEEEEVTRCICGLLDYPGPPLSEAFDEGDMQVEDAGGLFISCDECSVWQHGGCVGILQDEQVPDKYYCEQCKPKLHELHTDSRGQKYSLYQPVYSKSNRKPSVSKYGDKARQDRELAASRDSADPSSSKRRATMRSKELDDEDEQFRRAIEESKREIAAGRAANAAIKRNKRARDDGEETTNAVKRQRKASDSAPLSAKVAPEDGSDDDLAAGNGSNGKKAKAEAAQSARQAELREKEKEREKNRAEAAGRRQERAGRRRIDEEPSDETPKLSTSAKTSPPPSSQPDSPEPQAPFEKIKKGFGKKAKRLGNNQYTKNRGGPTSSPPNGKKSAGHSTSSGEEQPLVNGDGVRNIGSSGNGTNKNSPERNTAVKGKFGKGKHKGMNGTGGKHAPEDPSDLSMTTMKRRMELMAAFIAKAKTELTGDRTPVNGGGVPRVLVNEAAELSRGGGGEPANGKKREEMNAMELADEVSREIAEWQSRFGNVT